MSFRFHVNVLGEIKNGAEYGDEEEGTSA